MANEVPNAILEQELRFGINGITEIRSDFQGRARRVWDSGAGVHDGLPDNAFPKIPRDRWLPVQGAHWAPADAR